MITITIEDKEYIISDDVKTKLLNMLFAEGEKIFDKLGTAHQILAEQASRGILYSMEKKMIEKGIEKTVAAAIRPDKGKSPTKKLMAVMASLAREFDIPASVILSTIENSITDFSVATDASE
jgi:hypothetical protein